MEFMEFCLTLIFTTCLLQLQLPSIQSLSYSYPDKPLYVEEISEFCQPFNFTTQDEDPDWREKAGLNESTVYFLPLASYLEIHFISQNLFANTEDYYENSPLLSKSQMANSCIVTQMGNQKFSNGQFKPSYLRSFCGYKNKRFTVRMNRIAAEERKFAKTFSKGRGGFVYISLTDNKSYNVYHLCRDGLRSFGVLSTQRTLTPCQMDTIKSHLRGLGFVEDFFIELDYSYCWKTPDGIAEGAEHEPSCPIEEYDY